MRKTVVLFFLGALLIGFSSCSGSYHLLASKVLNNADMASYKTFSFVPYDQQNTQVNSRKIKISEADYNAIINAIRLEMNRRGLTETSDGTILIDIGLTVLRNATINTNVFPTWGGIRYYYPGYFHRFYAGVPYWRDGGYRAYTTAKIDKEGVLVMDMIDAKREVHLFTAAVSKVLDPSHLQLKDPVQLQQACKVLFAKFPIHPMKK
jgi:hypothetical protein